jgi:putative intracellular protease/amidase
MMIKKIVRVVTNVSHYADPNDATGLWLSELTHAWHEFDARGYEQSLFSPLGGEVPLELKSLKCPNLDSTAKAWMADEKTMARLKSTSAPGDFDPSAIDALYFTGGHAVMYDFVSNPALDALTRGVWEAGGVVASVCHGYCGLLDVKLADGSHLIDGFKLTGFSWHEEELAGVAKKVPFNAEQRPKDRGARYEKGWIPFTSRVVLDRNSSRARILSRPRRPHLRSSRSSRRFPRCK